MSSHSSDVRCWFYNSVDVDKCEKSDHFNLHYMDVSKHASAGASSKDDSHRESHVTKSTGLNSNDKSHKESHGTKPDPMSSKDTSHKESHGKKPEPTSSKDTSHKESQGQKLDPTSSKDASHKESHGKKHHKQEEVSITGLIQKESQSQIGENARAHSAFAVVVLALVAMVAALPITRLLMRGREQARALICATQVVEQDDDQDLELVLAEANFAGSGLVQLQDVEHLVFNKD